MIAGSPSRRNYSATDFDASTDDDDIEAEELPEDDEDDGRGGRGIVAGLAAGGGGFGRDRKLSEASGLDEEDADSDAIDYGISGDVTVMPKVGCIKG